MLHRDVVVRYAQNSVTILERLQQTAILASGLVFVRSLVLGRLLLLPAAEVLALDDFVLDEH